ncbi:hypothetical protein JXA88_16320 [Candidatus Fermentibacteria bacterium]|nr:hypothetical protein [Candidatus Fermentibacteria bacterium]
MRKIEFPLVLCLVIPALWLSGCSGKYADAKKVNAEFVEITETYVDDLEDAEDAKDVAKAVNSYADRMEKLWPRVRELSEKYPELKDKENVPDELKESQQRAEEMGKKMGSVFRKMMPYMNDPDVQKAQQRLSRIMAGA